MKKLFISQPMRGKTDEEILKERAEIIEHAKWITGEDLEVLDTFIQDAPADANPLWYLAKSLEFLSMADCAIFAPHWAEFRGCNIEHLCAIEYGIQIIRD